MKRPIVEPLLLELILIGQGWFLQYSKSTRVSWIWTWDLVMRGVLLPPPPSRVW